MDEKGKCFIYKIRKGRGNFDGLFFPRESKVTDVIM